jgi:hypothetical protein
MEAEIDCTVQSKGLVRFMSRLVICATLIVAAGCATKLQIVGPYANQLSHSDVQQITALIMISELNRHLYTKLEAVRPDKVLVKYVGYNRSMDGTYTSDLSSESFTAFKRNGRWSLGGEVGVEGRVTVH